jgi:hypothetical protein
MNGDVDLRAFRWPLAALERQRARELDLAWMKLAERQRAAAQAQEQLGALQEACDGQAPAVATSSRFDLQARAGALQYLVQAREGVRRQADRSSELQAQARQAGVACVASDRGLATVCGLREQALAAFVAMQSRRHARQADLAWLAGWARRRADRAGQERGA